MCSPLCSMPGETVSARGPIYWPAGAGKPLVRVFTVSLFRRRRTELRLKPVKADARWICAHVAQDNGNKCLELRVWLCLN